MARHMHVGRAGLAWCLVVLQSWMFVFQGECFPYKPPGLSPFPGSETHRRLGAYDYPSNLPHEYWAVVAKTRVETLNKILKDPNTTDNRPTVPVTKINIKFSADGRYAIVNLCASVNGVEKELTEIKLTSRAAAYVFNAVNWHFVHAPAGHKALTVAKVLETICEKEPKREWSMFYSLNYELRFVFQDEEVCTSLPPIIIEHLALLADDDNLGKSKDQKDEALAIIKGKRRPMEILFNDYPVIHETDDYVAYMRYGSEKKAYLDIVYHDGGWRWSTIGNTKPVNESQYSAWVGDKIELLKPYQAAFDKISANCQKANVVVAWVAENIFAIAHRYWFWQEDHMFSYFGINYNTDFNEIQKLFQMTEAWKPRHVRPTVHDHTLLKYKTMYRAQNVFLTRRTLSGYQDQAAENKHQQMAVEAVERIHLYQRYYSYGRANHGMATVKVGQGDPNSPQSFFVKIKTADGTDFDIINGDAAVFAPVIGEEGPWLTHSLYLLKAFRKYTFKDEIDRNLVKYNRKIADFVNKEAVSFSYVCFPASYRWPNIRISQTILKQYLDEGAEEPFNSCIKEAKEGRKTTLPEIFDAEEFYKKAWENEYRDKLKELLPSSLPVTVFDRLGLVAVPFDIDNNASIGQSGGAGPINRSGGEIIFHSDKLLKHVFLTPPSILVAIITACRTQRHKKTWVDLDDNTITIFGDAERTTMTLTHFFTLAQDAAKPEDEDTKGIFSEALKDLEAQVGTSIQEGATGPDPGIINEDAPDIESQFISVLASKTKDYTLTWTLNGQIITIKNAKGTFQWKFPKEIKAAMRLVRLWFSKPQTLADACRILVRINIIFLFAYKICYCDYYVERFILVLCRFARSEIFETILFSFFKAPQ
eukprot:GHVT01014638.1.p1 GENE.GHVT01014638.1~~GHVT01014638.1.p1  ORF type:complete len:873 (+),score=75.18 GHVT01014638.1:247-2865(+)